MNKAKSNNLTDLRKEAITLSKKNKNKYITVYSCFGAFFSINKNLHVNTPSDSCLDYYYLNGKEKKFSESQIIQDQINTLILK